MSRNLWDNPCAPGEEEITNTIERLLASSGLHIRPEDGRIVATHHESAFGTPWIHIAHSSTRHCGIWNAIYCRHFNLIPSFCRFHCWKTVMKPPTVEELFHLEGIMTTLQFPSKCGIDVRNYTPGPYAGFIYGDTLEDGRIYYRKFKSAMAAAGFDWPVLLKRGCTEMEMMKPSDQWDPMSAEDQILEKKLDDIFVKEESAGTQAPWHRNIIRRKWLRHALAIGDETWRNLVGDDVTGMHPHTVHYETEAAFKETASMPIEELYPICVERAKDKEMVTKNG